MAATARDNSACTPRSSASIVVSSSSSVWWPCPAPRASASTRSRSTATWRAPLQQRHRLLRFRLDLADLAAERLEVTVHALVLSDRLLDVLLAADALGLARLHVVVEAAQARAQRRELGGERRRRVLARLDVGDEPRHCLLQLAQVALAREQ